MLKTTRRLGLAIIMGALITACAPQEAPKQPDPTVAQINLTASADANPDPTGRPSPSVVFIYAMKPGAPFGSASYDTLTGGELGDLAQSMTLLGRLVIVPGKSAKRIFEMPAGTSSVGIAVAYRNVDSAKWRETATVAPNTVTLLKANVGANAITIE